MSSQIDISSHEIGVVRLFAIDLPDDQIKALTEQVYGPGEDDYAWPLKDALGATYLDHDFIEVFPVKDVAGLGLYGYMSEGLGVASAEIAGHKDELDAIEGHVLVVLSSAFDSVAQTLSPKPPLRLIGTFNEAKGASSVGPIHSEAAQGRVEPGETSTPDTGGRRVAAGPIVVIALLIGAALIFAFSGLGR